MIDPLHPLKAMPPDLFTSSMTDYVAKMCLKVIDQLEDWQDEGRIAPDWFIDPYVDENGEHQLESHVRLVSDISLVSIDLDLNL